MIREGFEKEMYKLVGKTGAWKLLDKAASRKVRSTVPERIMNPRPVLTEKVGDDGSEEVKCRLTLQGFKDPDLFELMRGNQTMSPTLSTNGRGMVLQLLATCRFRMALGDIESAFLISDPRPRANGPLYVTMPEGYDWKGVSPDQVFEVHNGYGLSDQPQQFWETLRGYLLKELNFVEHQLDPCVFLLREPGDAQGKGFQVIPESQNGKDDDVRGKPGDLCGVLGVHVDDKVNGGRGSLWAASMAKLRKRFPFRKRVVGEGEFTGSLLNQLPDFTIVQSQAECAHKVSKAVVRKRAPLNAPALPSEISGFLSTTQQGNWLQGQTRPDLSVQISLAQQLMPTPTVGQIKNANAWTRRAKQFSDTVIYFNPVPVEQLSFIVHTDYSSKDQDGSGRTQGGYIIGVTDSGMACGKMSSLGSDLLEKLQDQARSCLHARW